MDSLSQDFNRKRRNGGKRKTADLQHSVAEPQPKRNTHHGDTEARSHGEKYGEKPSQKQNEIPRAQLMLVVLDALLAGQ